MSKQVGLTKSGSEAQSDSSNSGSVTVKVASAFSGGTWAWVNETKRAATAMASSRAFMDEVTPILDAKPTSGGSWGLKRQYRVVLSRLQPAQRHQALPQIRNPNVEIRNKPESIQNRNPK